MEKYASFDQICKEDLSSFSGLDNEILTFIYRSDNKVPLTVESFGITFPDPNFHIKRNNSMYFILEYVISGKGHLKVGDKTFTLHPNDVYVLEPGSSHEYYADKNDPYKKIWVNFRSDMFYNIFHELNLDGKYVFRNVDISPEMEHIFALEHISRYNDHIHLQACQHLFSIFMKLVAQKPIVSDGTTLAQDIRKELDDAINKTVTIDALCEKMKISRSKLIRVFKENYNITPYAYLLNQKVLVGKSLLRNSRHSIKSIAAHLDFSDEHHFTNVFKKKTGMTPSEYRKLKTNISSK